jgi:hypothetical protein
VGTLRRKFLVVHSLRNGRTSNRVSSGVIHRSRLPYPLVVHLPMVKSVIGLEFDEVARLRIASESLSISSS